MDMNVTMSGGRTQEEQEAHDAKMAALADDKASSIKSTDGRTGKEDSNVSLESTDEPAPEATDGRPEGIPEKFWDAEKGEVNVQALLKAQQDAEAALRQQQQPKEDKQEQADTPEPTEAQANVVEAASDEYAEKGELSPETYESLAKVGITQAMVDAHISGVKAVEASLQAAAFGPFEGREGYDAAAEWAAVNLSDAEVEALDVQLTSTNPAIVAQGAAALRRAYAEANPSEGNLLRGDNSAGNTGDFFKSGAEMRVAMADPRYKADSAFRDEVAQKIARADKAGINLF